jgi:hypothetical protein
MMQVGMCMHRYTPGNCFPLYFSNHSDPWISTESIMYTKSRTLAAKLLLIINLNPASVIALVSEHVPPSAFAPSLFNGAPILTIAGSWQVLDACVLCCRLAPV